MYLYVARALLNDENIHFVGTFPTQRAIAAGDGSVELDEERRLCYVAMTRAKSFLIMTWRREVTSFFGQGFKVDTASRSRFLDALVSKKKGKTSNVLKGSTRQVSRSKHSKAGNRIKNERNSLDPSSVEKYSYKNRESSKKINAADGKLRNRVNSNVSD